MFVVAVQSKHQHDMPPRPTTPPRIHPVPAYHPCATSPSTAPPRMCRTSQDLQRSLSRDDLLKSLRQHDAGLAWHIYKRLKFAGPRAIQLEDHAAMLNLTVSHTLPVWGARIAAKVVWNMQHMDDGARDKCEAATNFMDTRDYNNAMLVHLRNDDLARVYGMLKQMIAQAETLYQRDRILEASSCLPNARSYILIIASLVSSGNVAAALDMYHHVLQKQKWYTFEFNPDVVAILLDGLSKAGRLSDAELLYSRAAQAGLSFRVCGTEPHARSFRMVHEAMVRAYGYHNKLSQSKTVFDSIKDEPFFEKLPDLNAYDAMMEAYKCNNRRSEAEDLWSELLTRLHDYTTTTTTTTHTDEIIPHQTTFIHLMAARASDGDADAVSSLFDELSKCYIPSLDAFRIAILAHITDKRYKDAVGYYQRMVDRGYIAPPLLKEAVEKVLSLVHYSEKTASTALKRLMTEYKELTVNAPDGVTAGPINETDFFTWEALIAGPEDTPFEGGIFSATLTFPRDYPLAPPVMRFTCPIFHPNVYKDGTVCISILHPPGDDPTSYESASERWSPVQSVEKILLSVVSMIAEPNDESPANLDAAKMWRTDRPGYEKIVRQNVKVSLGLD
ncbi:hypothetical protein SeLEV6574_g07516 [Synchytrium endobioticum]|uniref:E2 ubiquitin-conjugating enzyme n=1 Tax=Synchytrium endobioticum TaxID=286115 RepID=A0A507CCZ3_9FUNG|nr:hypothetical protein SeLEV6574_g07516 [Synchytrium endobioticum]